MSKKILSTPKRVLCVGDLSAEIIIQRRDILAPAFGSAEFNEGFSENEPTWARVKTVTGKTLFDGVNQDVAITHEIGIRYDPDVTADRWIEFDGKRLDIVAMEDLEERHEWLILHCVEKGSKFDEAAKA